MSFIDDHVSPFQLSQEVLVLDDVFVSREQTLKVSGTKTTSQLFTNSWSTLVDQDGNRRSPFAEFVDPIGKGRKRNNDEERTSLLLAFDKEGDEGDRLNRLSETL